MPKEHATICDLLIHTFTTDANAVPIYGEQSYLSPDDHALSIHDCLPEGLEHAARLDDCRQRPKSRTQLLMIDEKLK